MQLDSFDQKILDLVQRNSRMQTESIAEQVGLSASAVQRRLKKLRQQIYDVAGQIDLMVMITASNAIEYDAFIDEHLMRENPQIQRVKTHVVLDAPKQSCYVPVCGSMNTSSN